MEGADQPQPLSDRAAKRAARNSRVHFVFDGEGFPMNPDEETHPIVVRCGGEERYKNIAIYLGFLQQSHKYEVSFTIPMADLEGYMSSRGESILRLKTNPLCCQIVGLKWLQYPNNGLQVKMELQISSSLAFEDKFTIVSDLQENYFITVKVNAQVLGKGMGTPSLKDGIRCISVPSDDTASDISTEEPVATEDQ